MAELEREGRRFAVCTVVRTVGSTPQDAGARGAAVRALGEGTQRTVRLDGDHELRVEPVLARPRLFIAGGGHVGLASAKMATLLEYEVTVIDDREEFASRDRFGPGVDV